MPLLFNIANVISARTEFLLMLTQALRNQTLFYKVCRAAQLNLRKAVRGCECRCTGVGRRATFSMRSGCLAVRRGSRALPQYFFKMVQSI